MGCLFSYLHIRALKNIDVCNVKDIMYDFMNMKGYARIYSIYDGDTCTLVLWHNLLKKYIKQRIRMAHYDTAEIQKRTNVGNREDVLAKAAKHEFERLTNFVDGSKPNVKINKFSSSSDVIWYEVIGMDSKWNRPIVMIWSINNPKRSINAIIHERHGIDYEGSTKSHIWGDDRTGKITLTYDRECSFT